jgi:acetyltransferase-like isoleucine patch superfamily enzyme
MDNNKEIMKFRKSNRDRNIRARLSNRFHNSSMATSNSIQKWLANLEWAIRCFRLNLNPGIAVSKKAFVAKTVMFDLKPCGIFHGGSIKISAGAQISDGVILAPYGGSIWIDENVFIGPYCVLYGHGGLFIGRDTMIAAQTVIIPANHQFVGFSPIAKQPEERLGIQIGENVWIGAGVRILDGVCIGAGAVVGAGSVVTKSIEDNSIAYGVPAKTNRKRQ